MNFAEIIDNLLVCGNDFDVLQETVSEFHTLLSNLANISEETGDKALNQPIITPEGKAISPTDAARCVLDIARMTKFTHGIFAAIKKAQIDFQGEKIKILYAGCGPFAALALPHCTRFGPDEIEFTVIDVHQRSLDSARKIAGKLGFEDHFAEFISADAAVYKSEDKFHIIVTETMQKTLEKEPQVAITRNLAGNLRENGTFIPQKITVKAHLASLAMEFSASDPSIMQKARIPLGTLLELTVNSDDIRAPQVITIPPGEIESKDLILTTELEIFDGILLGDYESGITYPTVLHNILPKENMKIEFKYESGEVPGFVWKVV